MTIVPFHLIVRDILIEASQMRFPLAKSKRLLIRAIVMKEVETIEYLGIDARFCRRFAGRTLSRLQRSFLHSRQFLFWLERLPQPHQSKVTRVTFSGHQWGDKSFWKIQFRIFKELF